MDVIKKIFLGSILLISATTLFADVCNKSGEATLQGFSCKKIPNYDLLGSYISFKNQSNTVNYVGCSYQQSTGKKSGMIIYQVGDGVTLLKDDSNRIESPTGAWKRYDLKDSPAGVDRFYVCGTNVAVRELNGQRETGNSPYKIEDCQTISNYSALNATNVNLSTSGVSSSSPLLPFMLACYSDVNGKDEVPCSTANDLQKRRPTFNAFTNMKAIPIDNSVQVFSVTWCNETSIDQTCNLINVKQVIADGGFVVFSKENDNSLIECRHLGP